jgi:hypothetical protein
MRLYVVLHKREGLGHDRSALCLLVLLRHELKKKKKIERIVEGERERVYVREVNECRPAVQDNWISS